MTTPTFPSHHLPPFWAAWIETTAHRLGVASDYVAAGLLATVSAAPRAPVVAEPVPGWAEPLALSLGLVGITGAGKSRALAGVHRATGPRELAPPDDPSPPVLMRDELAAWLTARQGRAAQERTAWLDDPMRAVVGTLRPDGLAALSDGDMRLAARFLYFWPAPQSYRPLIGRPTADDGKAATYLLRIAELPGNADDPLVLRFAPDAIAAFDAFCATQHERAHASAGRTAAWFARAAGTVARLAAALTLLDWSSRVDDGSARVDDWSSRVYDWSARVDDGSARGGDGSARGGDAPPAGIEALAVARAVSLFEEYFLPHALLALTRPPHEQAVERLVRWLRHTGAETVSKDEIRRTGLGQTMDAAAAAEVTAELEARGLLVRLDSTEPAGAGRPATQWRVQLGSSGNAEMRKSDGDAPAASRRRGLPLPFELPVIRDTDDLMPAMAAVGQATAEGKISPADCRALGAFVKSHGPIIEMVDHERRLAHVEKAAAQAARLMGGLKELEKS